MLKGGSSICGADRPGADDMRIHAVLAEKERELISGRIQVALAAARARAKALGGDRGNRLSSSPDSCAAARVRREGTERNASTGAGTGSRACRG